MTGVRRGFVHEAAICDSDEAFLDIVVPFLRAGVAAGEPALLGVNARQEELVIDALGSGDGVTLLAGGEQYAHPHAALQFHWQMLTRHVDAGASRVRIVGEVPPASGGGDWTGWARYEAVINHLYAPLPVWAICPYDTRTTPSDVLADVERTHSRFASPDGGYRPSPRYRSPDTFLADRARAETEPFRRQRPDLELADPTPAGARLAVTRLAAGTSIDGQTVDALVFATNEVLTNALAHGRAPVELRVWAHPDRVTVAVRDRGHGPADPYVGLLRRPRDTPRTGGDGLWLAYQMCDQLTPVTATDGYTVYLTARSTTTPADGQVRR